MKSSQFLKVKDINCNILIGKNTFKRINSQIKSNNNISNIIIKRWIMTLKFKLLILDLSTRS